MIKSELLANLQPSVKSNLTHNTDQPSSSSSSTIVTHMTSRPTRKSVLSNEGEPALASLTASKLQQLLQDKAALLAGLSAGIQQSDPVLGAKLRSDAQAMLAISNQLRTKPGAASSSTQANVDAISKAQALFDSLAVKYSINRDAPLATEKEVAADAQALWARLATEEDSRALVARGTSTVEQWKKYGETKEGSELLESISKAVIGSAADWVDVAAAFAKQSLTFAHLSPDEMLAQSKLLVVDPEFRQQFIDEVKESALGFLRLYLPLMDIPHIKGHVQSIDFELDDLDASGFRIDGDNVQVELHDKGLTIDAKKISAEMNDITWKFNKTSFPKASGEGTVKALVNDASFHIELELRKEDSKTYLARMQVEADKAALLKARQEAKALAKREGGGRRGGATMDKERKEPKGHHAVHAIVAAPLLKQATVHPATFALAAKKLKKKQDMPFHLSLVLKSYKATIHDMQVKVTEADHVPWMYNLLLSLFSGTVRENVEKEVNAEIEERSHELLTQINELAEDVLPTLFKFHDQHMDVVEAAKVAAHQVPVPAAATAGDTSAPLAERRGSGAGLSAVTSSSSAAAAIASASALPSAPRRGSMVSVAELEARLQAETKRADDAVRARLMMERELKEMKHNMERALHQVNEMERERTQHMVQLEQRLKLAEVRAAHAGGVDATTSTTVIGDTSIPAASALNGSGASMSP